MAKSNSEVERIYDKYAKGYSSDEFAPTTFEGFGALSFGNDITWHYLRRYAPKRKTARILDAGAGNGDWAMRFAELGYKDIVLSDISQGMLDEAVPRFATLPGAFSFVKSDIRDLKELKSGSFDYVFSQYDAVSYCLEPKKAMKALSRVAKRGAYVVVSLDTKYRRVPELLKAGQVREAEILLRTNISRDFGHPQYNLTWEELAECFERAGLEVVEVVGAPVFMNHLDAATVERLEKDPRLRSQLLKMEFSHCTDRSLVNMAGHLQMVGRKR